MLPSRLFSSRISPDLLILCFSSVSRYRDVRWCGPSRVIQRETGLNVMQEVTAEGVEVLPLRCRKRGSHGNNPETQIRSGCTVMRMSSRCAGTGICACRKREEHVHLDSVSVMCPVLLMTPWERFTAALLKQHPAWFPETLPRFMWQRLCLNVNSHHSYLFTQKIQQASDTVILYWR